MISQASITDKYHQCLFSLMVLKLSASSEESSDDDDVIEEDEEDVE